MDRLLPYARWRKGQREIAETIYNVVKDGKILLLGYPTGAGKTIAALIGTYTAKSKNHKIFFLARTKNQVQAPLREISKIEKRKKICIPTVVLQNKKEMCPLAIAKRLSYDEFLRYCDSLVKLDLCEYYLNLKERKNILENGYNPEPSKFVRKFAKLGVCPYEIAKMLTSKVEIVIGSYVYIFSSEIRYRLQSSTGLKLEDLILIIDEAHNLPEIIADMQSIKLYKYQVKLAQREARKFLFGEFAEEILASLSNLYSYILTIERKSGGGDYLIDTSEFLSVMPGLSQLKKAVSIIEKNMVESGILAPSNISRILNLLRAIQSSTYGFVLYSTTTPEGFMIKYQCVDPSITAREVFSRVHAAVLMSGTLQPKDYLISMLALERGRVIEHRVHADFSKQVKLVVHSGISSRYVERSEENFRRIAKIIAILFEKFNNGVMLAVFPSYDFMKKVNVFLPTKTRLYTFIEREDTRLSEVVEFIKERAKSLVLAAAWGKLIEGIELRNGLSLIKSVVIAGLPVPEPSLVNIKREELLTARFLDEEKAWRFTYIIPAVIRVLQAIGRAVRTERDRAFVVILDHRLLEKDAKSLVEIHGYKVRSVDNLRQILEEMSSFSLR